jgi:CheY-like chemotaxis protein
MQDRIVNVLLVEDDEVDVMNVKRAFKKNHITNPLYVAPNGLEALIMLRGTEDAPPVVPQSRRLILLDLNMPKMGGIEFLRELRTDTALQFTPVVVLTTSNEDRDRVEAYNLNVAGYLLKPVTFVTFAELMATLNRYWALCEMP